MSHDTWSAEPQLTALNWFVVSYLFIFFLPFAGYCFYQLRKHQQHRYVENRYPVLIYCSIIAFAVQLFFTSFTNHCQFQFCNRFDDLLVDSGFDPILSIAILVPLMLLLLLRNWMLFFDLNLNVVLANIEWWKNINTRAQKQQSFFLRYRQTLLGTLDWRMGSCLAFYWCCSVAVAAIISIGFQIPEYAHIAVLPVAAGMVVVQPIWLRKMPTFDSFHMEVFLLGNTHTHTHTFCISTLK